MPKITNNTNFTLADFASTGDAVKLTGADSETIRRNKHKLRYVMVGKTHAWLKKDLIDLFGEADKSFDRELWYSTQEAAIARGVSTKQFLVDVVGIKKVKNGRSWYWLKSDVDRFGGGKRPSRLGKYLEWAKQK